MSPTVIRSLGRRFALLALALALCPLPAHPEEPPSLIRTVTDLTRDLETKILTPPSQKVILGGLILPGHEDQGTSFADAVITEIHATRLPERLIGLQKQIELGEAGVVLSDLGYPRSRTFDLGVCKNSVVMVNSIALQDLQPGTLTKGSNVVSMNQIAAHLGLSEVDIRGYVVVVRTVRARTSVPSCLDRSAANRVSDAIFSLTLAYSGGQPLETHAAVGNKRTLDVLQAFELDAIAADRTLKIKGIEALPSGTEVGWIGRVKLGSHDPDSLGDNEYNWLGAAPIGSQTLWPGRFYFRLKHKLNRLTVKRDLSVSDVDTTLHLAFDQP